MKLTGVILDWAGTLADHGSCAPVAALSETFASAGVPITRGEAREAMGIAKRAHIEKLLQLPRVRDQWAKVHGREAAANDVDELYSRFIPKQLDALANHSELIPGVPEAIEWMRARGLKIGTTTGYNRPMLDYLLGRARDQGFVPDCAICPEDAGFGRPQPFMCYLNAMRMGVYPMWTLVKIGDTQADIEEGVNAGMWTIGITRTGNEVGVTPAEWSAASTDNRNRMLADAYESLTNAGAHYIAESVTELNDILDRIEMRLDTGSRP